MMRPWTSRRHAVFAIVAIALLVLSGLGWSTWSAMELDRVRSRDAWNQTYDELRALALSRLDALVAPLLYRESARPYNHFRRYYKPTSPLADEGGLALEGSIVLESPLLESTQSNWVLLHFQARETEGEAVWSSPQIEDARPPAMPAGAIPAEDRARLATPENWLAALRDGYTPASLQNDLEVAMLTRSENRLTLSSDTGNVTQLGRQRSRLSTRGRPPDGLSRSATEFLRRGERLRQLEQENTSELCVPEEVALENLDAAVNVEALPGGATDCVAVWRGNMAPLWLDLTLDGRRHLTFVRSVSVEGSLFCTLQGVLVDWGKLREELEVSVQDLFPDARIAPVATSIPLTASMTHTMMQTIPARLEAGMPAVARTTGISGSLRVGLAVAWGATLLALLAIGYGIMKYVTLAERRMRFVAAVTHELRTPLTTFQLYTDLLADTPDTQRQKRRQYVDTLRNESQRLGRLVENVLAYSQIGGSKQSLNMRTLAPGALLDATRSAIAKQCAASGKVLVVEDRCPADMRIETDSEFVIQILTNLVENACKYSGGAKDPRVWLTAAAGAEGTVVFEVDDAGRGVSAHGRREVFQPFRRGDAANGCGTGGMGLGLGLALSRHWASCLGGRLSLRRSPRNGTNYSCFTLTLPRTVRV